MVQRAKISSLLYNKAVCFFSFLLAIALLSCQKENGQLVTPVTVGMGEIIFVRLVFQVVGNGNSIQSVAQCLLYTNVWPDRAIRQHRVHMKITFKGVVTGDIREFYGTIITGIICGLWK